MGNLCARKPAAHVNYHINVAAAAAAAAAATTTKRRTGECLAGSGENNIISTIIKRADQIRAIVAQSAHFCPHPGHANPGWLMRDSHAIIGKPNVVSSIVGPRGCAWSYNSFRPNNLAPPRFVHLWKDYD